MGTENFGKLFPIGHFTGLVSLFLLVLGCGNPVEHIPAFDTSEARGVRAFYDPTASSVYRLVPYDVISIKFPYHPEQDPAAPISVRPDGKISLEGAGEIQAVGLTPDQLAELIAEKFSDRMKDPQVVVTITEYAPKKVYVGGEIRNPGVVVIQDNMTPLQAIFDRGGFTDRAQVDSVILVRDAGSPNPQIGRINMQQAIEGGVPEEIALLPNDVLYIPMSGIARSNLWVKQHITDLVPRSFLRPPIPSGNLLFR